MDTNNRHHEGSSNREVRDGTDLQGDFAVCLSGGGYRAAGFHLGVLDLLHRIGLLDRLNTLSTISGGTIAGAVYTLDRVSKKPFEAFYDRFYKTLLTRNVVANAFSGIQENLSSEQHLSLIRAAAVVYTGEDFVGDARFSELLDATEGPDEVVFSATEFQSGLAYRFQTSRRSGAWIGNKAPLDIPEAVAREMRVADIMAASSCFPSAFESLRFPDDFHWDRPLNEVRADLGEGFPPTIPLMDGGIYDNQGIDGVRTVYLRETLTDRLGLFLISDTSPRSEPLFNPVVRPRIGGLRVGTAVGFGKAVMAGAMLSGFALFGQFLATLQIRPFVWLSDLLLFVIPMVLSFATAGAIVWLWRQFRIQERRLKIETEVRLWPVLRQLSISDVIDLVDGRLRSLVALTSTVFMKRIRRMIQDGLMSDERFQPFTAFNLIYDLDRERPGLYEKWPEIRPTEELRQLARDAEAVPTLLWVENENELQTLVACGQSTTCMTLLEHLVTRYEEALNDPDSEASRLYRELSVLWSRLKEDPRALLR